VFTIPWNAVHVAVESVFTIPWKRCSRSRGIRTVAGLLIFGVSLMQAAHSARSNTLAQFGT
jgi:hypothetical protein